MGNVLYNNYSSINNMFINSLSIWKLDEIILQEF